ncbi:MAG TPA: TonB-dependent receptor [Flavisolibacter sp.]|nr:TonB-dependent receptor [Flavisolibacter sp.]
MRRFLLFSLFILFATSAFSQARQRTQLSGTVTDLKTGEPLPGASILLTNSRLGTTTDSSGTYVFENIPVGHTIIEVSYFGYNTIVEHVDVIGSTVKNFQLTSTIIINEGVTVTAVGSATSIRKAPIPITRINKSELLATPSTNIIDAISRQPGVNQLSTGPAISKPVIRGLGYNRLVVINDGVRQEGQQWGDEHGIEIDENSVSRIEIVKGPASLIYGSDAMAGVINIITTTPAPSNSTRGNILSSYHTNNNQRSLFGSFGGHHDWFNWNMWGDYKGAEDYKNKYDGRVYNSKFNEKNFGGNVGVNGSWGYSNLIVSKFNQRVGVIEGARDVMGRFVKPTAAGIDVPVTDEDFKGTQPGIPYQGVQHFKLTSENSFRLSTGRISLNAGWQRNQRKEYGEADDPDEESLYFDLGTFNYNTAYHFDNERGWNNTIGFNGMVQNNQNKGEEFLIPEYNLFDIGAFVYSQRTLGKSTLSGGIRYDKRDLETDELFDGNELKFKGLKKKFYNFSGSAGISYAANANTLLKLNLARGFRAPSIPELSSNGQHEGTNRYEYGNPNLKSESSWQGDVGFELNSDHVLFNASAFYNRINNFIFYNKLSSRFGGDSLVMVDTELIPAFNYSQHTATLTGAEFLIDIHPHPLDWFHWENTMSFVRGRFTQPIEGVINVPFIPAARWISELRAELISGKGAFKNLTVHVELDRTFAQNNAYTANDTETPTPAYSLFNAGLTGNITSRNKTLFSVYLLGNNLTNVAYQSHLSRLKYADENQVTGRRGVFNMGRNFVFKVNIPFSFTR